SVDRQRLHRLIRERWRGEVEVDSAVANRTGEPGRAGANSVGVSGRSVIFALGRALGPHHQTIQRCVERAVVEGPMAALDDRPRPGHVTGRRTALLQTRSTNRKTYFVPTRSLNFCSY